MWDESTLQMLLQGVGETLYMTLGSTLFAYIIGFRWVCCSSCGLRTGSAPTLSYIKYWT